MRTVGGTRVLVAAITAGAAVLSSIPASAAPQCDDIAPNTRLCRTSGHAGITTSPDPALTTPYPAWGFGGIGTPVIGLGGGGFWIGF